MAAATVNVTPCGKGKRAAAPGSPPPPPPPPDHTTVVSNLQSIEIGFARVPRERAEVGLGL
uniref:Uncharacterized protein n=1 Tax=Oryza rufipogon TaxID=4529 RepID=A0A0E0NRT9_ORYRU